MFINAGTRELLLQSERDRFLSHEWPAIRERMQRLGVTADDLMSSHRGKKR